MAVPKMKRLYQKVDIKNRLDYANVLDWSPDDNNLIFEKRLQILFWFQMKIRLSSNKLIWPINEVSISQRCRELFELFKISIDKHNASARHVVWIH